MLSFLFFGLIGLGIIIVAISCLDSNDNRISKEECMELEKVELAKYMNGSSVKFQLYGDNQMLLLVYFNNNKLVFSNRYKKTINEIPLNQILKVDIEVLIQEKKKQELLTLTPTFYTQSKILYYNFKIITETETITLKILPKDNMKDLLERYKLILEKDINERK